MKKIGMRVGAIQRADSEKVWLLGYGKYEGDHIPDDGWLHDAGMTNPKITLDDGRVVWGYECWWGEEAKIKEFIGGREVVDARP